jgi:peptide/nickel transport system ATP-binding protein
VFKYHNRVVGKLRDMCIGVLEKVRVPSPGIRIKAYPFQFSGGMCQRVVIGMGVANNPELLIADEPTTALDVTIASQILQLMKQIQKETGTAILLITHDLATVAQICTRVLVMYAGRIVEKAPVKTFYKNPAHPYSIGLIQSVPVPGKKSQTLYSIEGQPPNLLDPPEGCRFANRCHRVMPICEKRYPPEMTIEDESHHRVCCWLYTGEKE